MPLPAEGGLPLSRLPARADVADRRHDMVAMMTGIGGGADGLSYHAFGEVMKQYNLKEKDLEQFIVRLDDRFHLVDEVLNIK